MHIKNIDVVRSLKGVDVAAYLTSDVTYAVVLACTMNPYPHSYVAPSYVLISMTDKQHDNAQECQAVATERLSSVTIKVTNGCGVTYLDYYGSALSDDTFADPCLHISHEGMRLEDKAKIGNYTLMSSMDNMVFGANQKTESSQETEPTTDSLDTYSACQMQL